MPRTGSGHLRFNPHQRACLPAAFITATSLGQAVAPPTFEQIRRWIANTQTEDIAREIYDDGLVCESGRCVWEMLLAALKLSKASVVDFAAVTAPVLVIGGECDRMVLFRVVRQTAARYQHGTYIELPGCDHVVFAGAALPLRVGYIDDWIARNPILIDRGVSRV